MLPIEKLDVKYIAKCARLSLNDDQVASHQAILDDTLSWFSDMFIAMQLDIVNIRTSDTFPIAIHERNYFDNEVGKEESRAQVFSNCTNKDESFIFIPKVV